MKSLDYQQIRQVWIKSTRAKSKIWLYHIDKRRNEIMELQEEKVVPIFEKAELLFNIFSFVNWLAHIDLRKDKHVNENELVQWLQHKTNWSLEAVEAFWLCLRNPNMHLAETNIFANHDRKSSSKKKLFADLLLDLNFDPKAFQPEKYKPTEAEDGYYAIDHPNIPNSLMIYFYYPGVQRKLQIVLESTIQNIECASEQDLAKLFRVNRKILPIHYSE